MFIILADVLINEFCTSCFKFNPLYIPIYKSEILAYDKISNVKIFYYIERKV